MWRYRELFRVLAWRDLAVRYKQTVIGVAWAVIRPLLMMIVFNVIFGRIAKLPTEGDAP
jgi:lipopolysaccharide transport system permease protein